MTKILVPKNLTLLNLKIMSHSFRIIYAIFAALSYPRTAFRFSVSADISFGSVALRTFLHSDLVPMLKSLRYQGRMICQTGTLTPKAFGSVTAYNAVVEFKQRGLPHSQRVPAHANVPPRSPRLDFGTKNNVRSVSVSSSFVKSECFQESKYLTRQSRKRFAPQHRGAGGGFPCWARLIDSQRVLN